MDSSNNILLYILNRANICITMNCQGAKKTLVYFILWIKLKSITNFFLLQTSVETILARRDVMDPLQFQCNAPTPKMLKISFLDVIFILFLWSVMACRCHDCKDVDVCLLYFLGRSSLFSLLTSIL